MQATPFFVHITNNLQPPRSHKKHIKYDESALARLDRLNRQTSAESVKCVFLSLRKPTHTTEGMLAPHPTAWFHWASLSHPNKYCFAFWRNARCLEANTAVFSIAVTIPQMLLNSNKRIWLRKCYGKKTFETSKDSWYGTGRRAVSEPPDNECMSQKHSEPR